MSILVRGAVCLLVIGLVTGRLNAALVTYTYTGPSLSIPDNNAAGTNADILVTDTFDLLSFQSVSVSVNHSWVGDLRVQLTHVPTGNTLDLFNRPGKAFVQTGRGDPSDLGGTYTFSNILPLTDPGRPRIIDDARRGGDGDTVMPGTYRPTTNLFNGDDSTDFTGEVIVSLNQTFDSITDISGIWRLNVADLAGQEIGVLTGFSFTVDADATTVPEPTSLMLLGCALAAGAGCWTTCRKHV